MDVDIESDTENDIAELQAALLPASMNVSERRPSNEHIHTIQDPNIQSTNSDNFSYISPALTLNTMLDDALIQVQSLLVSMLSKCRIKIQTVQTSLKSFQSDDESKKKKSSCHGYYLCGIPYFKDPSFFSAPPNPDTIKMKNLSIHNYVNLPQLIAWTAKNKRSLEDSIFTAAKARESVDVRYNVKKLEIQLENATESEIPEIQEKLYQLSDYFEKINTMPLLSLVEKLDDKQEYDWEQIAEIPSVNHNANECRSMWLNFLHPSINKSIWSRSEKKKLIDLILKYSSQDWDTIAAKLNTNRTGYQCFIYYKMHVCLGQNHTVKWTPEEDEFLFSVVDTCRIGDYIPWSKVAFYIENRTKEQIYNRYNHSLKGNKRAGRFTIEEDTVLMAATKQHGKNYSRIAKFLPTRSTLQIRIRLQILQSSMSIPGTSIWTVDDDMRLLDILSKPYFKKNPSDFSEMSKHFNGKSRSSIRARCHILKKWLKNHPKNDLSLIPRRKSSKNPISLIPDVDLETAVELLEQSLKKNPIPFKETSKAQSAESCSNIDAKFVEFFRSQEKITHSVPTPPISSDIDIIDVADVQSILLLLHAKLNKSRTETEPLRSGEGHVEYNAVIKDLLSCQEKLPLAPVKSITVKTYSRKRKIASVNAVNESASSSSSIWTDGSIPQPNQITQLLPPFYGTVAAFREIMFQTQAKRRVINYNVQQKLDSYTKLWKARFEALFLWPANISNVQPNIALDLFKNDECMDQT